MGPADEDRGSRTAMSAAQRLLILLVNTDPRNVEAMGAPFFYAAVAAAMDYEVDVLCTATAGKLMFTGVAEKLTIKQGDPMTVYGWIKEAHGQGARFWACAGNGRIFGKDGSRPDSRMQRRDGRGRHDPGRHGRDLPRSDVLARHL